MSNETWDERIAREKAENIASYRELYNGVAKYLDGWKVEETEDEYAGYKFRLVSKVGAEMGHKITLEIARGGKVHVSGYWPQRGKNGPYTIPRDVREESPSINCSLAKGHELIARDITRRFIPEYLRIWDLIKVKIAADETYANGKQSNWSRIVAAGVEDFTRGSEEQRGRVAIKGDGYSDVRMSSKDSVTLELRSIPVDVAIALIKTLREIK